MLIILDSHFQPHLLSPSPLPAPRMNLNISLMFFFWPISIQLKDLLGSENVIVLSASSGFWGTPHLEKVSDLCLLLCALSPLPTMVCDVGAKGQVQPNSCSRAEVVHTAMADTALCSPTHAANCSVPRTTRNIDFASRAA